MVNVFRERKHLAWQVNSVLHSADNLISGKGKHRNEFASMPRDLQDQWIQFYKLVDVLKTDYESFLRKHSKNNLPSYLKKHG